MLSSTVLVAALGLVLLYLYSKRKSRLTARLPRPNQGPFYKRLFTEPTPEQLIQWALRVPNDGLVAYKSFMNEEKLLITSPTGVHDVEVAQPYHFQKPAAVSKMLRAWLGDGLVTVEGETHKQQRKVLGQLFKAQWVKDIHPLFWTKTCEMMNVIRTQSLQEGSINLYDPVNRLTLDIIGLGGFGLDIGSLARPDNEFFNEYMKFFMPSGQGELYRLLSRVLPERLVDILPLQSNEELAQATVAVRSLIQDSIKKREKTLANEKAPAPEPEIGSSLHAERDIISFLMRAGTMSDTETLINQSMTLLGAGHDTTAQAITWIVYELCVHPIIQNRLRQEVIQAIPLPLSAQPDHAVLAHIVDDCPYLAAVINEVIRLHPSVPDLSRQSVVPARVNGLEIPPGVTCVVSLAAVNRSRELWGDDASVFNPDRWVNDKFGGAKIRNAFQTFGGGPKSCIGERFARAEMAIVTALLIRCFELEFSGAGKDGKAEKAVMEYGNTARFIGGLWVRAKAVGEESGP